MSGHVTFVGAGPGDPELLTLKAARLLHEADIVLYDALVGPGILALIRKGAQRICVGKRAGGHSMSQSEINRLLVRLAGAGRHVIRLKGGDPTIFARLGEETAALRAAGLSFAIVPGVTAASAAAAGAGISLTERGIARRLELVAGRLHSDNVESVDWRPCAGRDKTIAVYMAREAAPHIAQSLTRAGLAATTPVLVVANASLPDQTARRGTLGALGTIVEQMPAAAPVLLIIGAVAAATTKSGVCERAILATGQSRARAL